MLRRREVVAGIVAAAWPGVVFGQQGQSRKTIGVLMPTASDDPESKRRLMVFSQALEKAGWVIGRDVTLDVRYADGNLDGLPSLAVELVRAGVDVILTTGTEAVQASHSATRTIPIVMATIGDPVAVGVVASLARPGGNVTGLSLLATDIAAKRLQIGKELLPYLSRVAVLWNPNNASVVLKFRELEAAARTMGIQFMSFEARRETDLDQGFSAISGWGAELLVTADETLLVSARRKIIDLAMRYRMPVICEFSVIATAGATISYGPNVLDLWRRSATYVDKLLRGNKPEELPVEQPTKFNFVINLKTARALGIEIPPMLLARADEVIE